MIGLDRRRRRLAAALAALAGYVDATGFLWADRYFVSFMSGNTTRLASEAVVEPSRALAPAWLIAGFVLGVAMGGVLAHVAGHWRKPAVLALVTVLLANAWAAALEGDRVPGIAAMVLAMGALNNALQRDDGPVALTYLTGALVRIGQGLAQRLLGRAGPPVMPFVALWLSLAAGAALGACAFAHWGSNALAPAVLAGVALTGAGLRLARESVTAGR